MIQRRDRTAFEYSTGRWRPVENGKIIAPAAEIR